MRFVAASLGLIAMAACSSSGATDDDALAKYKAYEYVSNRGVLAEPLHLVAYCKAVGTQLTKKGDDTYTVTDKFGTLLGQATDQGLSRGLYGNIGHYILNCQQPPVISSEELQKIVSAIGRAPTLHEVLSREYEDCNQDFYSYSREQLDNLGDQCMAHRDTYQSRAYPVLVEDMFSLN